MYLNHHYHIFDLKFPSQHLGSIHLPHRSIFELKVWQENEAGQRFHRPVLILPYTTYYEDPRRRERRNR